MFTTTTRFCSQVQTLGLINPPRSLVLPYACIAHGLMASSFMAWFLITWALICAPLASCLPSSNTTYNWALHSNTAASIYRNQSDHSSPPKRLCSTGLPSVALLNLHATLQAEDNALNKLGAPSSTKFLVNTYFHVVSTQDQAHAVTPAMIANQFGILQAAYASSNISFKLVGTTYTVNDSWATDQADSDMKSALRQGNYSTLNIYFQTNLSTSVYGQSSQLLGYCTLPTNVTYSPCNGCPPNEYPAVDYAQDGCNVLAGSMPQGPVVGYNLGRTTIHEVGHWFGLLHTFQDSSCDPSDPGDYIDDTPQESVSTDGCPAGKDSCPSAPGLDPIHNYMDYSEDSCYESFTPDQTARMQSMYSTLRYTY